MRKRHNDLSLASLICRIQWYFMW